MVLTTTKTQVAKTVRVSKVSILRPDSVQAPLGFAAGDANLYRYVGNHPTNATDPSGLWEWQLNENGQVFAVSEKGDTLQGLINNGYSADKITPLAKMVNVEKLDAQLAAGVKIDITSFLPDAIQTAIKRQQQLDFEKLRNRVVNTKGPKIEVGKGKTVGTSGIDWARPQVFDPDTETVKQEQYLDEQFGPGNCYGFAAAFLGYPLPMGVPPQNFGLSGVGNEGLAGSDPKTKPGDVTQGTDPISGKWAYVAPKDGVIGYLTGGRKVTEKPVFGDVALFKSKDGIAHAAIVLGRTNAGKVILIQKLNRARVYTISPADGAPVSGFGTPTYYTK